MRVTVVGAGVLGLTCAVRLAEAGHQVSVVARDLPQETTSAVAAAWWYPYRAAPQDAVARWSARTYACFEQLAGESESGVRMRDSVELVADDAPAPWWGGAVHGFQEVRDDAGRRALTFTAPVAETPAYLPYLAARLRAAGGDLTRLALSALPSGGDLVVNCSGLAARSLVGDESVYPVRGQVVVVEQVGLERVWLDTRGPGITYLVPRAEDIVVGGTSEEWSWEVRPDPPTARAILERAAALVPEVARAEVRGHRVGLRPARPEVRLEREERGGSAPVVHCYGHGGAGITLSWGCADEVLALAG